MKVIGSINSIRNLTHKSPVYFTKFLIYRRIYRSDRRGKDRCLKNIKCLLMNYKHEVVTLKAPSKIINLSKMIL